MVRGGERSAATVALSPVVKVDLGEEEEVGKGAASSRASISRCPIAVAVAAPRSPSGSRRKAGVTFVTQPSPQRLARATESELQDAAARSHRKKLFRSKFFFFLVLSLAIAFLFTFLRSLSRSSLSLSLFGETEREREITGAVAAPRAPTLSARALLLSSKDGRRRGRRRREAQAQQAAGERLN